jgi:GNAT superfamily N-acetyltransferase
MGRQLAASGGCLVAQPLAGLYPGPDWSPVCECCEVTLPNGLIDVPPGKIAAVVTSLEMRERAPLRAGPADPAWQLRLVPRPEVGWYRDLYRRIGQDWLWFSRLALSETALARIIRDPQVEVCALEVDGRDEGLLELDFRQAEACELAFFGLTAPLLGTGAGRWLMNQAIARAWARPIRRFWVHTCTLDHPGALTFYVRSGFRPFRRQIEIADDPRLTGAAPRTAAPHVPVI